MQVNKEIKSDCMKKRLKKQNNPKFDEFIIKVDVKRFSCKYILEDFKFNKSIVKIAMGVC